MQPELFTNRCIQFWSRIELTLETITGMPHIVQGSHNGNEGNLPPGIGQCLARNLISCNTVSWLSCSLLILFRAEFNSDQLLRTGLKKLENHPNRLWQDSLDWYLPNMWFQKVLDNPKITGVACFLFQTLRMPQIHTNPMSPKYRRKSTCSCQPFWQQFMLNSRQWRQALSEKNGHTTGIP